MREELKRRSNGVDALNGKSMVAIVAAHNHYAGFSPASTNSFRKMLGPKEAEYREMKRI
jgi:hypothetical protein